MIQKSLEKGFEASFVDDISNVWDSTTHLCLNSWRLPRLLRFYNEQEYPTWKYQTTKKQKIKQQNFANHHDIHKNTLFQKYLLKIPTNK